MRGERSGRGEGRGVDILWPARAQLVALPQMFFAAASMRGAGVPNKVSTCVICLLLLLPLFLLLFSLFLLLLLLQLLLLLLMLLLDSFLLRFAKHLCIIFINLFYLFAKFLRQVCLSLFRPLSVCCPSYPAYPACCHFRPEIASARLDFVPLFFIEFQFVLLRTIHSTPECMFSSARFLLSLRRSGASPEHADQTRQTQQTRRTDVKS